MGKTHKKNQKDTSSKCILCLAQQLRYLGKKIILGSADSSVTLVTCLNCLHRFVIPLPNQVDLDSLYEKSHVSVIGNEWQTGYLREDSTLFKNPIWRKYSNVSPGRVMLEIGPGNGFLLNAFSEKGWITLAIEKGNWLKQDNIYRNRSELPSEFVYDLIIMQDVIEHLSSPIEFLREYVGLLNKKGILEVTCPYGRSIDARFLGTNWEMVRPLGHLHFFSKKSFQVLAKNLGLTIVSIKIFRRDNRLKGVIRLFVFPLLYIKESANGKRGFDNVYHIRNLRKFLVSAFSSGDQMFVTLSKD